MKTHILISEIVTYSDELAETEIEKLSKIFQDFELILFKKELNQNTRQFITTIKFSHTLKI